MARERCTSLCTRSATGQCTLCDSLDARDAFFLPIRGVWAILLITIAILCILLRGLTWPFRRWWFRDAALYIIGPTGYRAVVPAIATLVAAYVGIYAIVEARHERQMNRALFEQNRFMTLAASGSPGGLNAALAEYETLKARKVLKSPDIWRCWTWHETEAVNRDALKRWAERFFAGCPKDWCGQGLDLRVLGKGDLKEADLRGANLQKANLYGANLQQARLWDANLQNANLSAANLQQTDLSQANLQKAFLWHAQLQRAKLWHAKLQETYFWNANLQQANLSQANLQKAQLSGANLQQANLKNANLQKTQLSRANLQQANLKNANLQQADLAHASLQQANLRGAKLRFARRWLSAQIHMAYWDERTQWPDDFIPPCQSYRLYLEPCEFLDLLATDHLLMPSLDRLVQVLHDRIPERSSVIAGMIDDVLRQAPIR